MTIETSNKAIPAYTLSVPQNSQSWEKREQIVESIIDGSQKCPAYSQIVNLATGERFNLLGERLQFLSDDQWSLLLNVLVMSFVLPKAEDERREALLLTLRQQVNTLIKTLPKQCQDDVVNRATLLLTPRIIEERQEDIFEKELSDDSTES